MMFFILWIVSGVVASALFLTTAVVIMKEITVRDAVFSILFILSGYAGLIIIVVCLMTIIFVAFTRKESFSRTLWKK